MRPKYKRFYGWDIFGGLLRIREQLQVRRRRASAISLVLFCATFIPSCTNDLTDPTESSASLDEVFLEAGENENLLSLIVYKDDRIVKEMYYHGGDSTSPHDVRSVTKSVMATLIGIAIDKRMISSDQIGIGDYLRTLIGPIDSAKGHITIRDLLTMTSGLDGNDIPEISEYGEWYNAQNQIEYTLGKQFIAQPGQVFGYNSGAVHLLSAVLTQAVGMPTREFAYLNLFQPLGIAQHYWDKDKQGIDNGAAGLSLTPHDMLKIGQLYLKKGSYNGIRVVSENWVEKATSTHISTGGIISYGTDYGYLWWLGIDPPNTYYFANGYGGQFILVVPNLDVIVVATNKWKNVEGSVANQQWSSTLSLIMDRIVPLLTQGQLSIHRF